MEVVERKENDQVGCSDGDDKDPGSNGEALRILDVEKQLVET